MRKIFTNNFSFILLMFTLLSNISEAQSIFSISLPYFSNFNYVIFVSLSNGEELEPYGCHRGCSPYADFGIPSNITSMTVKIYSLESSKFCILDVSSGNVYDTIYKFSLKDEETSADTTLTNLHSGEIQSCTINFESKYDQTSI